MSNVTKFKELFNSSATNLSTFMKYFNTLFIRILDKTVNGLTIKKKGVSLEHKYYTYFISIILILILCLFYYLNEKQNLFTIKNTKYEILAALMLIGFSIYCFLFFAYRNRIDWKDDTPISKENYNSGSEYAAIYKSDTRKIVDITDN